MSQSHTATGIIDVTDKTFEQEVLARPGLVLVDFWAEWCPPCRMIAPVLDVIARERADSLTICKLNHDENLGTVRDYQIMSLPTLLLFRDGELVRTMIGAQSKMKLLAAIDAAASS
ncbi:thioredoxin [Nocardia sp. NPDC058058]|uniref:thioredoxin n=1 Tax=Nocardia sp. NPDC058058 TaxID=3346317 RepID=UPI0036D795E3